MSTIGMKLGTKAFGQTTEKPTGTVGVASNLSATEMSKLGGENVGEVLNKISDPNWVDPSKKMRTVGNDKLDKDAFFKLMLAQMKNQDPTNPLKPHEMSAQLANFSALEQMTNVNTTLNEIKNGQKPVEQFQALNLLGKAVSGDAAKVVRAKGDTNHDFTFNLGAPASEAEVKVRNSAGDVVRTYSLKNLKAGENRVTWNGLDDKGTAMAADEYTFGIEAKSSNGQKLAVKTDFEGTITGINYTPEGPVLMVGTQTIRLRDVRKIVDPGLMRNDQNLSSQTPGQLKTTDTMQQTESKQTPANAAPDKAAAPNLMDSVSLSREMMDKVQKESGQGG